ncbi:molybdopterin-synthase adenylyltransferase MoeB [Rhodococcus sp. D2-41]|uniref:Molybdopterin-synthase adenylyltransferase MoeB n=1 Tax=Speluncibacter jeojiensis TaxID=2710754 RepID=A0A9X4M258_9ACTN|nr:molybdopterin-synthase adenylyltransferase MoeB [Rhodococcus sp. D2-41]MDG3008755.1 molybdopterin-synthase adenylyltransferase MoeB [Rhodococcus sp. D2-41]MDG3013036.1 molybdopterin-synthase adenylyltransferase MoeB [Corynebacteriales bacterium D3-21]
MGLPPLVEPGPELTTQESARYSRHTLLPELGVTGQRRLKNARVLVIGAGGLGSPTLLYLAAAGVGTIGIVEFDDVELSNLQRQIIHGESDIGRPKGESARESIAAINSGIDVVLHPARLDAANAVALFERYDLILDGTDNFATRYLVNDAAVLAHRPYVWGSIFRFAGQVSVFWEDAPDGRGLNYRDLYPQPPEPGTVPSCAEGGVLGVLCAAVGAMMATEAVKLITGMGESLLGRLLIYDALAMSHRTIELRKDPDAQPITELVDYELFCGTAPQPSGADTIGAAELHGLIESGADVRLVDVREQVEWDIVHLPGATLVPNSSIQSAGVDGVGALLGLPAEDPVVLYCKSGVRSAQALELLRAAGYRNLRHLEGGIEAWASVVDPTMVRY